MSEFKKQKIMDTSQEEGHVVKAEDNSEMTPRKTIKKILEPVADTAIPTMAFLLLDPTKMQNEGTDSSYHDKLRDAFQVGRCQGAQLLLEGDHAETESPLLLVGVVESD
ncbi:hypothetical protein GWK47_035974 [Chionoecetes opilio]|uniref:Uncharacterized protein n=1 Tax=Chionoecetes opilio TaxID=41210 RepID=A0A8J4YP66_CHIOP|nr:hypothetical protein GWK47_035974 [Chionoecetes opilio]